MRRPPDLGITPAAARVVIPPATAYLPVWGRVRPPGEVAMLWEKLALTMAGMLLVTAALHMGGRRLGGLLAGLPTITAPTLAWTALEQGTGFAVHAAIGSVASCAALAVFALAYVHASRSLRAAGALACGAGAAALAALPALQAADSLTAALVLAVSVTLAARAALPTPAPAAAGALRSGRQVLPGIGAACIAAMLTVLVTLLAPVLGPLATGLLASLPLVSGPLAMAEHAGAGHQASTEFLRGYVRGLFGKAAFGTVFVLLAPGSGVLTALAAAVAVTALMTLRPQSVRAALPRLNSPPR
ncbi:hypothetical protein [Pelomonas cellulosilytica]|uniref:Uncharacterized protein n=1 Tax=Pelomonas cellulosilytica TaxID=2906762 RepID=A0ABS8Y0X8_9BURK|nr:hypothetical protein [Pelomonas sp. P8]MCE4556681.1 hypothetical protein [Pelomonas sp. P8]